MTLLFTILLACHRGPETPPALSELATLSEEAAGKRLMAAPPGLLRLDAPASPHDTAVIAVHGFRSEGREWVGPLQTMAGWGTELYFYRWNFMQCPDTASVELDRALDALVAAEPSLQSLVVIGHSYGGLLTAYTGQNQTSGLPAQLHLIAAPLAGVEQLTERCPGQGMKDAPPSEGVRWHQWRTVHEADGAFKDMATDPQLRELPGLELTLLPEQWEGGRLGHNRSIQYVVRALGEARAAAPAAD